jgi:hypothetical protein
MSWSTACAAGSTTRQSARRGAGSPSDRGYSWRAHPLAIEPKSIKFADRDKPCRLATAGYQPLLDMDEPFPDEPIHHVIAAVQKFAGLGDGECFDGVRWLDPLRYRAEPKCAATAVFKPTATVGSQSRRRRARDNFMSVRFHLRSTPRKYGFIVLGGKTLSLVLARSSSVIFQDI